MIEGKRLIGVLDSTLEELERVCKKERIKIIKNVSVKDGDIFYNPKCDIVIIGNCINKKSFDTLISLIQSIKND